MIEYIYTGKLYLDPDLSMDLSDLETEDIILALLQAETFLQVCLHLKHLLNSATNVKCKE